MQNSGEKKGGGGYSAGFNLLAVEMLKSELRLVGRIKIEEVGAYFDQ